MDDLKLRYYSVMMLHALGDTIGFKNGDWEFNYYEDEKYLVLDYVNELIYEFIYLGGVNGINLKGWHISDDTMLHIAVGKSMLHYDNMITDNFIKNLKKYLHKEAVLMWKDENDKFIGGVNRYIGVTTSENIAKFEQNTDARYQEYDMNAGGNGAAMRSLVIGLCLYGENKRDELIKVSILSSQLTHNNALGYLAGFTSSLFTALAMEKKNIELWPHILLKFLRSDKLKSYLSAENEDQIYDHISYIRYWQKYVDNKFDKNNKPIRTRSSTNPMYRMKYYYDNFFKGSSAMQIGSSGYLCMIMAYDSLLDCDGKWEKLIVYSMLHSGDSDTIGAIAGGLYGAVYSMGDVPKSMLKYIERKKEIEQLSYDLFEKYKSS